MDRSILLLRLVAPIALAALALTTASCVYHPRDTVVVRGHGHDEHHDNGRHVGQDPDHHDDHGNGHGHGHD